MVIRKGHMVLAVTMVLALAACKEREPVEPAINNADDPEQTPAQSIIRPDVEQPKPAQALTPLKTSISFAQGGADLSEDALAELATVRQSPQVAAGGPIVLRGHSDAGGNDAANMRASAARATAVADWLVEMGISAERINVIAFGEQNPTEPNALPDGSPNEAGREANRRVDLTVQLPVAVAEEPTTDDGANADE